MTQSGGMRVFHLIAPGPIAGAERVVLAGTRALGDAGLTVSLGVIDDTRITEVTEAFVREAGVPVTRVLSRGRVDPFALGRLRTGLEIERPQLVHVHGYKSLILALLARPAGLPIVATHHGTTSHDAKVKAFEWTQLRAYRRVDHVCAVAPAVASALRGRGLPPDRVSVVTNPVALNVGVLDAPAASSRVELLFLGRLSVEKGLEVLIEALGSAPDSLHLRIVGDGPSRAGLEAAVARAGLEGRVHFAGFVADVGPELARCHAVVLPSLREGLPMALLEAAAAGRPFVATRTGGVPSLLTDGGAVGLLAEPGDPRSLAAALRELVERLPKLSNAAAAAGPQIAVRYGTERWARDTVAIYRSVLR